MSHVRSIKMKLFHGLMILTLIGSMVPVSMADTKYRRVYDPQTHQYYYVPESSLSDRTRSTLKNPIVKKAVIGAAVGAAAGLISDNASLVKGAGVGALAGAGTGLIDNSRSLGDNPLARTAIKGAIIGTGASAISGRGYMKGALVGAAAGGGYHYLKKYLGRDDNRYEQDRWW